MPRVKIGKYDTCQLCLGRIVNNKVKIMVGNKDMGYYHNGCADKKFIIEKPKKKKSLLQRLFKK